MSKISKLGRAISLLLQKPYLINKILEDKDANKSRVIDKYKLPRGLPETDIRNFIKQAETTIDPFCFLDGGSLPTDLLLLKSLASAKDNSSYFEIGTWRGESVANVASVAEDCYTLNLSDEELRNEGLSEDYIKLQRHLSQGLKNVTHVSANSMSYDFASLNKKFDLIFIDGDHRYAAVKNDSEKCFDKLRHANSVMVWHDYKYTPDEIRWEVLLGILDGIPKEHHKHLYGVSNTLCAIYYPFPLQAKAVEYPLKPDKNFKLNIRIE